MNNKYLYVKIFGMSFLILLVIFFIILYFFPNIKEINKLKREIRDMNLKITDFVKVENKFKRMDLKEKDYFDRLNKDLQNSVEVIKSKEDFLKMITNVSDFISKQAIKDKIDNLIITFNSRDMKINAKTLSNDKETISSLFEFATQRIQDINKEINLRNLTTAKNLTTLDTLEKGYKKHTIYITFTGDLRNIINFLNHLTWGNKQLLYRRVIVKEGTFSPIVLAFVNIYYKDLRNKNEQ